MLSNWLRNKERLAPREAQNKAGNHLCWLVPASPLHLLVRPGFDKEPNDMTCISSTAF